MKDALADRRTMTDCTNMIFCFKHILRSVLCFIRRLTHFFRYTAQDGNRIYRSNPLIFLQSGAYFNVTSGPSRRGGKYSHSNPCRPTIIGGRRSTFFMFTRRNVRENVMNYACASIRAFNALISVTQTRRRDARNKTRHRYASRKGACKNYRHRARLYMRGAEDATRRDCQCRRNRRRANAESGNRHRIARHVFHYLVKQNMAHVRFHLCNFCRCSHIVRCHASNGRRNGRNRGISHRSNYNRANRYASRQGSS